MNTKHTIEIAVMSTVVATLAAGGCAGTETREPDGFGHPGAPTAQDGPDIPIDGDDEDDEDDAESDGGDESEFDPDAIDDFVYGLGHIEIAAEAPLEELPCDPMGGFCPEPWQEGEFLCQFVDYSETTHAKSITALQPESLWPGAIVRGQDSYAGDIVPIVTERAEGTFSISLDSLQGSPVGEMEAPTLATFRDVLHEVLAAGTQGATAAAISHQLVTVSSSSQFQVYLGADVGWDGGAKLEAMFDFSESEFENRFLLDFTQVYFSADFEPPKRPSALFGETVTVEELTNHMEDGDPPLYVSSVKYGRRVLFAIETNSSLEQMSAAISAALNANVGAELELDAADTLAASKLSAFVIGGSGDNAVKTVQGPDGLVEYLLEGGDFSAESPGLPIAFSLAYLDNTPAKHAFTAQFSKKVCEPI